MHRIGFAVVLIVALAVATPSQAQLRSAENTNATESLMTSSAGVGFLMNTIFNPKYFQMSHEFEMSMGSGSYGTSSLAMYTNSLQWQFGSKLAAQADVSVAYSPFGGTGVGFASNPGSVSGRSADVFLRNAAISYKPTENMSLNLSYHRSPYGNYMRPYGWYRPSFD